MWAAWRPWLIARCCRRTIAARSAIWSSACTRAIMRTITTRTIASCGTIASIATIIFFFTRELLSDSFKGLVISFESNRLYFVNLDATLHDAQDGDAVNIEVGFHFQYITCF
jgi:hypothetical protein